MGGKHPVLKHFGYGTGRERTFEMEPEHFFFDPYILATGKASCVPKMPGKDRTGLDPGSAVSRRNADPKRPGMHSPREARERGGKRMAEPGKAQCQLKRQSLFAAKCGADFPADFALRTFVRRRNPT